MDDHNSLIQMFLRMQIRFFNRCINKSREQRKVNIVGVRGVIERAIESLPHTLIFKSLYLFNAMDRRPEIFQTINIV